MKFIWKDDFFFAKIGIFCKSIADPLPNVVQAYAKPYSNRIISYTGEKKMVKIRLSAVNYKVHPIDQEGAVDENDE